MVLFFHNTGFNQSNKIIALKVAKINEIRDWIRKMWGFGSLANKWDLILIILK